MVISAAVDAKGIYLIMSTVIGRLQKGFGLLMKTTPLLMVRLGIYAAFAVVIAIYFLIFGGLAYLFSKLAPAVGGIVMLVSLCGFGGLWYWVRKYILYMVRAAHVAVMTEILINGKLPDGVKQLQYGKDLILENVKDVSILFAIDALVDGILKAFTRTVSTLVDILPLPGIDTLAVAAMRIVDRSLTYIDEAIFSYGLMRREEQTLWASAKDGVILYAQCWKELLKVSVSIWLIGLVSFFILLVLFLIPGLLIGIAIGSGFLKSAIALIVITTAYVINLAFFEPLALAAMIVTFQEEIEGKVPDPAWEERLNTASSKFNELKRKAEESMRGWNAPDTGGKAQPSEQPEPVDVT